MILGIHLGYPFNIFTDQGRYFGSQLFQSMCKLLQTHKPRTTSYRSSANGRCERFNITIMNDVHVRRFVDKTPKTMASVSSSNRRCVESLRKSEHMIN